ncbi:MAG: LacI family DNA-binding transcriptional regulator [Rubellimicrobium sp.]|nr:LacI family DNA-binding transcriptional regulator [Rubellimicrobium sp.]
MDRKPKTPLRPQAHRRPAGDLPPDTTGTRPSGKPAVTIRDVARHGGVSIATVSRVINNEAQGVSPKTRARIQSLVKELNYRPSRIGQALRGQATDTYALVISNIQNSLYAAIAWELERRLNDGGGVMLLFNTNENADLQDRCLAEINARHVSGLFILCAVESRSLRQTVAQYHTVFINRRVTSLGETSFVGVDDYAAARDVVSMIVEARHLPLGVIHGPLYSDTSASRLRGLRDALHEKGIPLEAGDIREADLSMDGGYRHARELLRQKTYRALFCGSDQIAYGAYRACCERGLAVPDDIQIYGFDGNPLNEWLAPWLNTVRIPHTSFASEAIRQLASLREGGVHRSIILPYDIVAGSMNGR